MRLSRIADVQGGLIARVFTPVRGHPVAERAVSDTEFTSDRGDRPRPLDHHLHCFFPELRGEIPLRAWHLFSSLDQPILLGWPVRKTHGSSVGVDDILADSDRWCEHARGRCVAGRGERVDEAAEIAETTAFGCEST